MCIYNESDVSAAVTLVFTLDMDPRAVASVILLVIVGQVRAFPKFETDDGKAVATEKGDYGAGNGDQLAMESHANATELSLQDRPPRFGFPTYTSDVQGYSQSGAIVPGVYGPVKLDIGGLLLGTIVGLGAFFILPKLLHVAAPYGPYKRSEDEQNESGVSLSDVFARVQESLDSYNVDSTACMQRAVCYSIQAANEKTNNTASSMDNVVDNIAKNDITKTLIDGTEWKRAVDVGESGGNCSVEFPKCPFSLDSVASSIAKYLVS